MVQMGPALRPKVGQQSALWNAGLKTYCPMESLKTFPPSISELCKGFGEGIIARQNGVFARPWLDLGYPVGGFTSRISRARPISTFRRKAWRFS